MNEYGFFGSKNRDRTYSSDDFSAFFSDIFTDGILGNSTSNLQVIANNSLSLTVKSGTAYIDGRFFRPVANKTVTLKESDATYARYDLVVLRCDYVNRKIYLNVITGVPSATPTVPKLQRNTNIYDLGLASVYVKPNTLSVTQSDVRDLRFDNNYCGVVTGAIKTIDTTKLFAQYEARWDLLMAGFSGDEAAIIAAFNALLTVKSINGMSPDSSGNLSLTLDNIPDGTAKKNDKIIKCGTVETDSTGIGTVTFDTPFNSVPVVVVTGVALEGQKFAVASLVSVSESGFTVRFTDYQLNVAAGTVHWIAMGV